MSRGEPSVSYEVLDEALERLALFGPDLRNGMTSHAPMAAEALCALGRPDAVIPWVERYRKGMLPPPPRVERILRERWRDALSKEDRFGDWSAFFREELEGASWQDVLERWVARLAPGICAAATHGVLRVGHAARSLGVGETRLRRDELAAALASWAATYQELPTSLADTGAAPSAREALLRVALVPPERRRFSGTIVSALAGLSEWPAFAPAIGLLDVAGDPARCVADVAEAFAQAYLENARDVLGAIVFVHGVTSVAAVGNLLPHLEEATARRALRYAWQAGCGLYATFGHPAERRDQGPPSEPASDEGWDALVARAVAHGDEHAIKFAEACLRLDHERPSPAYAAAVRQALATLPRA
jgi:hypothetical protein